MLVEKWTKKLFSKLQNEGQKRTKFNTGDLIPTADIKRGFFNRDSTNWSYHLYTISEVIHDTIPSYRINYLREKCKENLLRSTKLTLDENNQIMKDIKSIEKKRLDKWN